MKYKLRIIVPPCTSIAALQINTAEVKYNNSYQLTNGFVKEYELTGKQYTNDSVRRTIAEYLFKMGICEDLKEYGEFWGIATKEKLSTLKPKDLMLPSADFITKITVIEED